MTTRKRRRTAYVPTDVFDGLEISSSARALYIQLCGFANKAGECFPSQQRLANELGYTVRTVQIRLNELEAIGLVERLRKPGSRHRYRVIRDRADISATRLKNQQIASARREQFGKFGRRGAKQRHGTTAKVKTDSPAPEAAFTSEVNPDSPKQSQEQNHSNMGDNPSRFANAPASGCETDHLTPSTVTASLGQDINWTGWANWLGKVTDRDAAQSWAEIFTYLDHIKDELGLPTSEAETVLDRFLKIIRRSFPTSPSFDELLLREKKSRERSS